MFNMFVTSELHKFHQFTTTRQNMSISLKIFKNLEPDRYIYIIYMPTDFSVAKLLLGRQASTVTASSNARSYLFFFVNEK